MAPSPKALGLLTASRCLTGLWEGGGRGKPVPVDPSVGHWLPLPQILIVLGLGLRAHCL